MRASHLIVTGSSGYIGARLVQRARAQGRSVVAIGRASGPDRDHVLPWCLGEPLPSAAVQAGSEAGQALIHLAHDWQQDDEAGEDRNVVGTTRLFADAEAIGLTRVFVSSQSARADAPNRYGRTKWQAEQRLPGAACLRVGLVYGGPQVAMFGLMCRLSMCGVVPMVEPGRPVQPIHLDEVVDGILAAADGRHTGVLALAGPTPMPFGTVLALFGEKLFGRRLIVVPVPLLAALAACDLVRIILPRSRVDRERVLGLVGTRPMESAPDLARLGVRVCPMARRLACEPAGRRARIMEAAVLLRACLGRPAPATVLRRYARMVPDGAVARLPLPFPVVRWCEPLRGTALRERFRLAGRLSESSVTGEAMLAGGSRKGRLLRLGLCLIMDVLAAPLRAAAGVVRR